MMTAAPVQAIAFLRSRAELAARPEAGLYAYGVRPRQPGLPCQARRDGPGHRVLARSRGEIRLRSPSADDKPVIDHRLLEHPDDIATIIGGIRHLSGFRGAGPGRHVVGRNTPADPPKDDASLEEQIRLLGSTATADRFLPDGR